MQRRLPVGGVGQRLFLQLQVVGQAVDGGLYWPAAQREAAVGGRGVRQDDQVLQLDRQSHRHRRIDPAAQLGHRDRPGAVARVALPESRLPVRLDQQVGLAHLPELAGVHDGAYQLACRAVLHEPALSRRFDGLLHFGPDLLDDAGLDLGVELWMRRVLVGEQLAQ